MTSGQFRSISISSITVNREGRQRRELDDLETLADSIRRLGLIQPIVITHSNDLVAGERRLEACRLLGHTDISAQYVDELDGHTLRAIELEENIKRQSLPWKDECLAVYDYYQARKAEDSGFSQRELAEALGLPQSCIADRVSVARELRAGNKMVIEAPRLTTAVGITERASARKDAEARDNFHRLAGILDPTKDLNPILNLDFNEWVTTYDGPRFNFIHCDFPYGIGASDFNQGSAATHGGYVDTARTYWTLCESLCSNLDRLAADSCHFMFWFSMWHYGPTIDYFAKHSDITFDPFPLIWVKSDNVGILPDPQRGPRRIYETALFGSRGDRKVVSPVSNAIAAPTDRGFHMSVKPEPVLRNFFRMFVDETTFMLDPTCGSGSSVRAAEDLSARYVLGLEVNNDFCEQANRSVRNARVLRRPK